MNLTELIIKRGYGNRQIAYDVIAQDLGSLGYNYSIEEIRYAVNQIKEPSLQQQIDSTKGLYL